MLCSRGILIGFLSQLALLPHGFLVPSSTLTSISFARGRLAKERATRQALCSRRIVTAEIHAAFENLEGMLGGSGVGKEDPLDNSVIPNAVGKAAIQEQLDAIKRGRSADQAARATAQLLGSAKTTPLRAAWVLIFNHGPKEAAHRGLYCLWSDGINSVVAFEGRDGALRYALELKAQGLGLPGPTRVAVKDLQRFCCDHGFGLELVPVDVVPVAPDKNKEVLGFETQVPEDASVLTPDDVRKWRAKFERLYLGGEES